VEIVGDRNMERITVDLPKEWLSVADIRD